ncbi:hypothetical protein SMI01S_11690 [Sphingobacterium mizutaii NBRC 14946 = DSM 11724]|uniref:Uncharacterized protein n=2 Tax=Sphingobacterium mizutaii TaxID=1010 RepID=A0AAJ4XD23_9SPHI|nr:hypothetical protein [Sphingobacterium mizutaii]GEM67563.1 hypothetical protein SMI01S_11690 [Sphingobacterium mizutaii NBRC 14946 = DSM 11724]SDL14292.1 hypothetical protein SAMN05192578_1011503 [Sphingobacterium mizutaii]SNV52108.1 Uncharacterised protein [Sphingobacterium mizutaii]
MAAGEFNKTALTELQLRMEEKWYDKVKNRDYNPDLATAKVIKEQQTATVKEIEDESLDRQVSVNWVDFCQDNSDDTVTDDDSCDIVATEPESKSKLEAIDTFVEDSFKVNEEKFRGNFIKMEEAIAVSLMGVERNLINKLNKKLAAKLLTFGGVNQYAGAGTIGTNVGGYTEIPAANFTAEGFFPYLQQAGVMNKFSSLLVLDGGNLFQDNYRSKKFLGNDDGKAAASMYGDLTYRNDLFGFNANAMQDVTIVLDPGSIAFGSKSRFPETPREIKNPSVTRYSVPSNYIPGLRYDVTYKMECINGKIWHSWNYKIRTGLWLNPIRCNENITGVLLFKKKAAV